MKDKRRTKVRQYECTASERNAISKIERRTSNVEVPWLNSEPKAYDCTGT